MINANELRIGNYLQTTKKSLYPNSSQRIIEVDKYCMALIIEKGVCDSYEPIPLTREIFEACGYIDRGEEYYQPEEQFECIIKQSRGYYWISNNEFINEEPLLYLHQLQNLYFSLTGKELEIKLPVLKIEA